MTTDAPMAVMDGRAGNDADGDAALQKEATLLDLVDRLLDKGVVLSGDVTLSVADVDLVYVSLRVLISSVEAAQRRRDDERPGGSSE
jgi:hypothetical protein